MEGWLAALAPGRSPLGNGCSLGGCGIQSMSVAHELVLRWYRGGRRNALCLPVEHIATCNKFVNWSAVA
jgi:hypothetical protein